MSEPTMNNKGLAIKVTTVHRALCCIYRRLKKYQKGIMSTLSEMSS